MRSILQHFVKTYILSYDVLAALTVFLVVQFILLAGQADIILKDHMFFFASTIFIFLGFTNEANSLRKDFLSVYHTTFVKEANKLNGLFDKIVAYLGVLSIGCYLLAASVLMLVAISSYLVTIPSFVVALYSALGVYTFFAHRSCEKSYFKLLDNLNP